MTSTPNDAPETEFPPEFLAQMTRRREMQELTNDDVIQEIWSHWGEQTPGRVDFVLRGHVAWESRLDEEIDVGVGWIRPTVYEPVRSGPDFEDFGSAIREYGAGVPVKCTIDSKAEEASREIFGALSRISLMADVLGFLTGFSVQWRPARLVECVYGGPRRDGGSAATIHTKRFMRIDPHQELTATVLDDDYMRNVFGRVVRDIWTMPEPIGPILQTAVSWQAQAANVRGLGRYVHYWASVELLAEFLDANLPASVTKRTPDSEIKQKILENLLSVDGQNYMKKVEACGELARPSVRGRVKRIAALIEFDEARLFSAPKGDKSLYQIRNDIAHGNVSHSDRTYISRHSKQLERFPEAARDFVVGVAQRARVIAKEFAQLHDRVGAADDF